MLARPTYYCYEQVSTTKDILQQMSGSISLRASLVLMLPVLALSQDTRHAPNKQLIPAPDCLTMKGAWQGGYTPCDAAAHEAWLDDVKHWRTERRIRIGYNGSRYEMPAL